jgi:hypothetical protein
MWEVTWVAGWYATCHFLGIMGDNNVHPEVAMIIDVHDRTSRCHEPLGLA